MNTARLERQIYDWWLVSGGYLYSSLNGNASLEQTTQDYAGVPVPGTFWSSDVSVLKRESHILSLANLLMPAEFLSASLGVQSEWTRQEGVGRVHLDEGDPNLPGAFDLYPATIASDLDQQKVSENVSLRFTRIPWTVLFAEARLDQETIGQSQQEAPFAGTIADPELTFIRDTDFSNDREEFRGGFSTSPASWVALSAHYKRRTSDSDYANTKLPPESGYPGFLRARSIDTDEVQAKLVLRPWNWLKTALTYQQVNTDYSTTTDPVPGGTSPEGLLEGRYEAHVYGANATLTPFQRLYLSGTLTYSDSQTRTAGNQSQSIVPYRGGVYGVMVTANYTLNKFTDLHASYSFSQADYGQVNYPDGVPLGLNYTRHGLMVGINRRITSNLSTGLRYGFYKYSEPSTGGVNDYSAHGIFATLNFKWP
jgi:hypothetical protein